MKQVLKTMRAHRRAKETERNLSMNYSVSSTQLHKLVSGLLVNTIELEQQANSGGLLYPGWSGMNETAQQINSENCYHVVS